ncbi:hypothetical protein PMIN06_002439 [Paraphaeosphaeria minitans]
MDVIRVNRTSHVIRVNSDVSSHACSSSHHGTNSSDTRHKTRQDKKRHHTTPHHTTPHGTAPKDTTLLAASLQADMGTLADSHPRGGETPCRILIFIRSRSRSPCTLGLKPAGCAQHANWSLGAKIPQRRSIPSSNAMPLATTNAFAPAGATGFVHGFQRMASADPQVLTSTPPYLPTHLPIYPSAAVPPHATHLPTYPSAVPPHACQRPLHTRIPT